MVILLLEFGITIIKVTCRLRIALYYGKYKTKNQKWKTMIKFQNVLENFSSLMRVVCLSFF